MILWSAGPITLRTPGQIDRQGKVKTLRQGKREHVGRYAEANIASWRVAAIFDTYSRLKPYSSGCVLWDHAVKAE